jgi:copper chaperone NosL
VAAHPKFAAAIELTDGRTFYFCGTGCLIRTWLHPEVFLGVSRELIKQPVAQDYFTGTPCDARQVLWVAGSDIMGPMGPALVPLKNPADLAVFKRRHGGKHTFRLPELDDATWQSITGRKALPEHQSQS